MEATVQRSSRCRGAFCSEWCQGLDRVSFAHVGMGCAASKAKTSLSGRGPLSLRGSRDRLTCSAARTPVFLQETSLGACVALACLTHAEFPKTRDEACHSGAGAMRPMTWRSCFRLPRRVYVSVWRRVFFNRVAPLVCSGPVPACDSPIGV